VDGLTFDGSAETNGGFVVRDTWGNDYLVGGRRGDTFVLSHDLAQDRVFGGPGDDVVKFANMDISDSVDGGAGYDTLKLGTYLSEGDPLHIANVERVALATDAAFVLIDDTAVAAGKVLEFDATEVAAFTFSGFAETDGHLKILGGSGNGEIDGGAAADVVRMQAGSDSYLIAGNGAADRIVCNSGKEVLRYLSSTDSTGAAGHDVVRHFDADQDQFEFYKGEVSLTGGVAAAPILATVNAASFDADLHAAGDGGLAANGAWVVHVTHGDLHGHEFLCVDTNGNAMYVAGTDCVIDITGYTGTLDASDFILSS
jgi:Ca2+-binding RTX toxin-like protein